MSARTALARQSLACCLGAVILAACGTGDRADVLGPNGAVAAAAAPAHLLLVSGNNQIRAVGTQLPSPLVVKVTDAANQPVGGTKVAFAVTAGGGSLTAASATTGTTGQASTRFTLGPMAGIQSVRATVVGLTAVTFTATARKPTKLILVSGNNQTGTVGSTLPNALVAKVVDAANLAVPGMTVTFAMKTGGGSVVPLTAKTGSTGRASTQWTLGASTGAQSAAATSVGLAGSPLTFAATAVTRRGAFVDRADNTTAKQIHVMYVLPSDGVDRKLDLNGTLMNTVGSFQTWLGAQTGGRRLRMDTYQGVLDITFVRLGRSDATMKAYGAFVRDSIEKLLASAGFAVATKIYAVYYDGGSTFACGGGAWPPALPGRVGALYLRGTPPGAPSCTSNSFATSPTSPPGYLEFAMLHELMHVQGLVSSTAPNQVLSGHVNTGPSDLMYAGPLPWTPSVLDLNRKNYYNPSGLQAGVLNLAKSSFLEP